MARLFTITIPFKENYYKALVSLCQQGNDLLCRVRYLDKEIRSILPGNVLLFSLAEGLKEPKQLQNDLAEQLVLETSKAIIKHINHITVSN